MRVRPFFWILLASVCAGVVLFAAGISARETVPLRARIDQVSRVGAHTALVRLRLTDPEGMPVDQARVTPHATMPAMDMAPQRTSVQALGQGSYLARITFSMTGAWKIDIVARAAGFSPMQQSIVMQVF